MSLRNLVHLVSRLLRRMSAIERTTVAALAVIFVISLGNVIPSIFETGARTGNGPIYSEGIIGYPRLVNPLFVDFNEVDRDIGSLVFSGLLKYDPTVKNFVPDLAESITRSENNRSYTLKLKQNALWHDGAPVTADDVIFTFQHVVQDPGFKNPVLQSAFRDVRIEKSDAYTVTFTLQSVNSFFPSYLVTGLLPAHKLNEASIAQLEKHPYNRNPTGTGMFRVATPITSKEQDTLLLERFENYYGTKPHFGMVRFSFYETAKKALKDKNKFLAIPKVQDLDAATLADDERLETVSYELPQYTALFFNLDRPQLAKRRFRELVMQSIDKDALAAELGGVKAIDTIALRRNPENWLNVIQAGAAEKIVKELGYEKGEDGYARNAKNELLTFTLLSKTFPEKSWIEAKTVATIDFIKRSLKASGIKLEVRRESGENFLELLKKREYDMLLAGQSLGYNTDSFAFWHSTQSEGLGLNFSKLKSFRIDSILEDFRGIFDWERKKRRLAELEQIIEEQAPALFLYTPTYSFIKAKTIEGLEIAGFSYASDRFANFDKVFR